MIPSKLYNLKNKWPFAKAVFMTINELAYRKVNENSTLQKQAQSFYTTSKLGVLLFAYELD